MKTAIYIENGFVQLVLTPDNQFEKDTLLGVVGEKLSWYGEAKKLHATVKRGSFYHCQGGFVRQGNDDDSLIITNQPQTMPA